MKEFVVAVAIVLVGLVVVYVPFGLIWSVNVLFSLTIPYTFKTWCAATLLSVAIGGTRVTYNKK